MNNADLYGYATALTVSSKWSADNLAAYRARQLRLGASEGELQLIEAFPSDYIKGGWPRLIEHAQRLRAESCQQNDLARIAAGLSKGKRKAHFVQIAAAHHANAIALSDIIDGPGDCSELTDAELLAALT